MTRPANAIYTELPTTIFAVMSALAAEHGAVNLGQGFPDGTGPPEVLAAGADALLHGWNQYPPLAGLPELRSAVADHDRRFWGIDADPASEVLVTSGATEALAACFLALLSAGDEAIVIEPAYDSYAPMIRRAGATPRFVRLAAPTWDLDIDALRSACSARTAVIVLNDPLNPVGKVFTEPELVAIGELAVEFDAVVVCDEVYEHLTFDGRRHQSLRSMPAFADRSVRIGSAGKTFSLTGWKVGYINAPAHLFDPLVKAHQFLTFTTPPNLQAAIAVGLRLPDDYFVGLGADMQRSRDRLVGGLAALGIQALDCGGTYFCSVPTAAFGLGDVGGGTDGEEPADLAFARHLTKAVGVTTIPLSSFYSEGGPDDVVRLCFAKVDATIDEALARLGPG